MDEHNETDLLDSGLVDEHVDVEDYQRGTEMDEPDDGELEVEENEDHILEEGRRLLAAAEAKLASVERALERLDSGNYGLCEVCATPITPAALTERPSLARCAEHDQSS